MNDDEIVELWKRRGNIASARGTLLHWHAEMQLNGRRLEEPHSPEFKMLLGLLDVLQQQLGLRPFRTELCLFHCGPHACPRVFGAPCCKFTQPPTASNQISPNLAR